MCETYFCEENYGECYFCFQAVRLENMTDEGVCKQCLKARTETNEEE